LIAVVVLVPFMIWEEEITAWVLDFRQAAQEKWLLTTGVVIGLLASDIVAPIPNSIIATMSGFLLEFIGGTIVSTIGMVISCVIGYYVGLKAGRPTIGRFVGDEELARLERLAGRFGYWAVALTRALPVLGEAAVIFAGMSRMPIWRFLVVSVLSCLGLSAVYAAAGHYMGEVEGNFIYAFLASFAISALGMLIVSQIEKRSTKAAAVEPQAQEA
jgi:membrane protein DedA with SNARE-associated domain